MKEIANRLHENRQIELAKSILESAGYKVTKNEELDEGLFDNKAKKAKQYDEEIKKIFKEPTMRVVANTKAAVEQVMNDCGDNFKSPKEYLQQIEKISRTATADAKKDPERVISNIINLGRKYAQDSAYLDDLVQIQHNIRQLQKVEKVGFNASKYLLGKISEYVVKSLEQLVTQLKKDQSNYRD